MEIIKNLHSMTCRYMVGSATVPSRCMATDLCLKKAQTRILARVVLPEPPNISPQYPQISTTSTNPAYSLTLILYYT